MMEASCLILMRVETPPRFKNDQGIDTKLRNFHFRGRAGGGQSPDPFRNTIRAEELHPSIAPLDRDSDLVGPVRQVVQQVNNHSPGLGLNDDIIEDSLRSLYAHRPSQRGDVKR